MNFLFKVICPFFHRDSLFAQTPNCYISRVMNLWSVLRATNVSLNCGVLFNFAFCCALKKLSLCTFKSIYLLLHDSCLCYARRVLHIPRNDLPTSSSGVLVPPLVSTFNPSDISLVTPTHCTARSCLTCQSKSSPPLTS